MKFKITSPSLPRRVFLMQAAGAAATLAAAGSVRAQAQVAETDANAVSLGYRADATKVDKAKFPAYKPGQACANCALYQAAAGAATGGCPLFAGKQVVAKGWCSAYAKKA